MFVMCFSCNRVGGDETDSFCWVKTNKSHQSLGLLGLQNKRSTHKCAKTTTINVKKQKSKQASMFVMCFSCNRVGGDETDSFCWVKTNKSHQSLGLLGLQNKRSTHKCAKTTTINVKKQKSKQASMFVICFSCNRVGGD